MVDALAVYGQSNLDLHQAIQTATENNPRLVVLLKKKAIAEAEIKIAEQLNNPSFVAEDTRSKPNYFVGGGYVFELGGKRGKRADVAKSEAKITELDFRSGLLSLRHDVRVAFYEVLGRGVRKNEIGKSRDLAQRLQDIANQRFDAGEVAKLEVLSAQLELKQRENEYRQAEAEEQASEIELNALLNRPLKDPLQLNGSAEDMPQTVELEPLINRAISENPEAQAAEEEMKAEQARLSLAHAERVPDLEVEGGTEISDTDFQYGWRANIRIELPILNRKTGEISRSNAALESLQAQQTVTIQKIRADVSAAYLKYQAAAFQSENYRKDILPASKELEEMAEESYKEGRTGILAVIDAQRNSRQIRLDYSDVLMQFQTAVADLELASGVELP
ncbi:MAG: hypothetical protein C5B54_04505 [Acidobacteria bacterium]|nr:MAG: hypothetical protein C5B54_04505 [Acidobacteriota bacterium]